MPWAGRPAPPAVHCRVADARLINCPLPMATTMSPDPLVRLATATGHHTANPGNARVVFDCQSARLAGGPGRPVGGLLTGRNVVSDDSQLPSGNWLRYECMDALKHASRRLAFVHRSASGVEEV